MGPSWSRPGLLAAWRSSPRPKSPSGTGLHGQPRYGEHAPKRHIKALLSHQDSQGRVLNVTRGQLGSVDTTRTSPYVTVWPEKQKPHMSPPQWGLESHL